MDKPLVFAEAGSSADLVFLLARMMHHQRACASAWQFGKRVRVNTLTVFLRCLLTLGRWVEENTRHSPELRKGASSQHMGNKAILTPPANDVGSVHERSPIDLRIHGADFFVSGHFHRWQAATTMGRDLDELSVRMAVDVTSPDQLTGGIAPRDLFSFHSGTVLPVRSNLYLARGELVTAAGARPFEMVVEAPEGHNAFCGLSFIVRRDELGAGWKELVTGGSGAGGIDAERLLDPRSGVRDFELAAA